MKSMAQFTGFMSLVLWGFMILTEIVNTQMLRPYPQSPFVLWSAVLFALWSIGWTVRDAMEGKKGQE